VIKATFAHRNVHSLDILGERWQWLMPAESGILLKRIEVRIEQLKCLGHILGRDERRDWNHQKRRFPLTARWRFPLFSPGFTKIEVGLYGL